MTIYKYYSLLIPMLMIILWTTIGCKHDHNHDHGHDDHSHDDVESAAMDESSSLKSVELNAAQYQYAAIDTGWFLMKNIGDVVNANGYTKLDPQDEADVNVPIEGTIATVHVIEGNFVKKGQTLATMTSLTFNNMKMEKLKLKEELAKAEANLSYLKDDFARQEELAKDNINAQKVFQKVKSEFEAESRRTTLVKEQIELLEQSLAFINEGGGSRIKIKAPISGYITNLEVKIGSIVNPGKPLFSIVDNSKMHVDLLVYEKDLSKIKVGQTVRFILTNQSNQEIKGEIYNIGKSFANETKSVAVHADIEENDANLIPGMYINALIDIGTNKVTTLPEEAIVNAEGRDFIFLWESENTSNEDADHDKIHFTRIEVKTGANQLGFVETVPLHPIPEGDRIVLDGAYYLQSHLLKTDGGGGHHH